MSAKSKLFVSLVRKEFWHVLRDKRSLFILLGLPVVMMLIFGFALSNEVKNSKVIIWDQSHDESSRSLIEAIDQSKYFDVVNPVSNMDEAETMFRQGKALLLLVIPPDLYKSNISGETVDLQIIADGSDPNTSSTARLYLETIIRNHTVFAGFNEQSQFGISVQNRMMYNPQLEASFNFVPGVMTLIMMLLGAMMTSVSIVKEKELGTMEVLLVSPIKPMLIVFSKAVPYLLLSFCDVMIILILAYTVLDMPYRGGLVLLLSESVLFILTTLSLGLLISTNVDSQQSAMFISLVGLLMPSLVFSGFMFPIENMPRPLQVISNVIPTRWFFEIVKKVMVKGLDFSYIIKETLILLSLTAFFFAAAMKSFKIRLE